MILLGILMILTARERCRLQLLSKLLDLMGEIFEPWLLSRDFNDFASLDESSSFGPHVITHCTKFQHWLDDLGLLDLPVLGPILLWRREFSFDSFQAALLDRSVCNVSWYHLFNTTSIYHLQHFCSDHCPQLVNLHSPDSPIVSGRLRFQVACIKHNLY